MRWEVATTLRPVGRPIIAWTSACTPSIDVIHLLRILFTWRSISEAANAWACDVTGCACRYAINKESFNLPFRQASFGYSGLVKGYVVHAGETGSTLAGAIPGQNNLSIRFKVDVQQLVSGERAGPAKRRGR